MKRRHSSPSKPAGQRQLRVGERIRHILSTVLRRGELRDPALENASMITVTAVDVSPDLKNATAFIMPLGGKDAEDIAVALNKATGYFRTAVGAELEIRHTPKITFKVDLSFAQAEHIEKILRQSAVARDINEKN